MNWNRWSREVSEAKAERKRVQEERIQEILNNPDLTVEQMTEIALEHVKVDSD